MSSPKQQHQHQQYNNNNKNYHNTTKSLYKTKQNKKSNNNACSNITKTVLPNYTKLRTQNDIYWKEIESLHEQLISIQDKKKSIVITARENSTSTHSLAACSSSRHIESQQQHSVLQEQIKYYQAELQSQHQHDHGDHDTNKNSALEAITHAKLNHSEMVQHEISSTYSQLQQTESTIQNTCAHLQQNILHKTNTCIHHREMNKILRHNLRQMDKKSSIVSNATKRSNEEETHINDEDEEEERLSKVLSHLSNILQQQSSDDNTTKKHNQTPKIIPSPFIKTTKQKKQKLQPQQTYSWKEGSLDNVLYELCYRKIISKDDPYVSKESMNVSDDIWKFLIHCGVIDRINENESLMQLIDYDC